MSQTDKTIKLIDVMEGDISDRVLRFAKSIGIVAWDIETTGLSFRSARIATCQLFIPGNGVFLVRSDGDCAKNLVELLEDASTIKIFHHATFDLGFLGYHWRASGANIKCTKIASKILDPTRKTHSLKPLLSDYLGVEIDKAQQTSDWTKEELSNEQLDYAALDVLYLPDLYSRLATGLRTIGRQELAQRCFDFIPYRVALDIIGSNDVYSY